MLAFLSSLLLVALVNAQNPEPCEAPHVWNARQMSVDLSKNFAVFARLSYDADNERISIVEEVDVPKKRMFYEYILLYREKTMYQIELSTNKTGTCVKKDLSEEFRHFRIPANATGVGKLTIGSNGLPGLGVNVNVFVGEMRGDRYYATVTEEGCLPVSEGIMTKQYGYIHTSFFDVEIGVDPDRFVPPRECEDDDGIAIDE